MNKIYNKFKEIIIKYEHIIIAILCIIAASTISFNVKLNNTDELWNFSNIYKIYNGGVIYNDCNIIQTPIFFYMGLMFFKLFGANYLIFRIYNVFIYTALYLSIYQLFRELKANKTISKLAILIAFATSYKTISGGANYNVLSILFTIWRYII